MIRDDIEAGFDEPGVPVWAVFGDLMAGLLGAFVLIRYFQSTWSRLSADRRLTQSLSKVPENAGPLNSHHLVHRSLTLMRDISPEYLNRFMAYVDALSWVDQLNAGGNAGAAAPAGAAGSPAKKSGRSRPG